jgi:hypothetical protein
MYNTLILSGVLVVLALLLIHFRPGSPAITEGFSTAAAVNENVMPACVTRSTDAQSLLARISSYPLDDEGAAELRQLVSKLCCMEADIASPSAGVYRTMNFQFRTSEDTEPPSTIVGRCLRNATNKRDIEIIVEKFKARGHVLIRQLCKGSDVTEGLKEYDAVVARLLFAMTSFCLGKQPSMDRPIGARDMGFWEPEEVSELSQYQGISSSPK